MASNKHAASWRARRPSQGLLVVHLPDVKAQRQKVIVSKWPHPLALQGSNHVVDMTGPTLPRPCRARHRATIQKRNSSNSGRKTKQSSSCTLSQFVFLENGLLPLYSYFQIFQNTCSYVSVHISTVGQQTFMKHHIRVKRIRPSACLQGTCWPIEVYNETS